MQIVPALNQHVTKTGRTGCGTSTSRVSPCARGRDVCTSAHLVKQIGCHNSYVDRLKLRVPTSRHPEKRVTGKDGKTRGA